MNFKTISADYFIIYSHNSQTSQNLPDLSPLPLADQSDSSLATPKKI